MKDIREIVYFVYMFKLNVALSGARNSLTSGGITISVWLYGRAEVNFDIGSTIGGETIWFQNVN
jgi:hypothetical protein